MTLQILPTDEHASDHIRSQTSLRALIDLARYWTGRSYHMPGWPRHVQDAYCETWVLLRRAG